MHHRPSWSMLGGAEPKAGGVPEVDAASFDFEAVIKDRPGRGGARWSSAERFSLCVALGGPQRARLGMGPACVVSAAICVAAARCVGIGRIPCAASHSFRFRTHSDLVTVMCACCGWLVVDRAVPGPRRCLQSTEHIVDSAAPGPWRCLQPTEDSRVCSLTAMEVRADTARGEEERRVRERGPLFIEHL